ncbi:AAA family ATPase [Providencia alcalifaciens]|uniref:AAA domain protein n=1 Tax=Providencia alcalifaciens 205/92 TaxID=1256988 RepID=A0AAV3M9L7_9GAMM|nr:AAA family ATPase [Providencia alcalifaciens]EUD12476.1 AAA domain protein [Providencia alcalifaciens 205/92]MTC15838.1 AAA family ATPase [Providencia alcalifaciens]MTC27167.1 AAA family ATPase [Providencia alcalifaciens]MTC62737.1 AAA family ATPase [Providencia alcalifaciens]WGZ55727.1 AAA family ATPase [Providencia alcalifaciens]
MKYLNNIDGGIPHTGISDINIPLNGRNLIITGKNGSGKTSFLSLLSDKILLHLGKEIQDEQKIQEQLAYWEAEKRKGPPGSSLYSQAQDQIDYYRKKIDAFHHGLQLVFVNELELISNYDDLKAIFVFFSAMRISSIQETKQTSSIEEEKRSSIDDLKNKRPTNFGSKLEQHLVNIKVNQSLAITEDNNQEQAHKFQEWFYNFDEHLKFLFEDSSAKLVFYRQSFKFKISLNGREFDFQNLSSGYLAIFDILADLIVRTEFFEITPTQLKGIVIIDEIDAHLHISLQQKILPFFTKLFPQIQFIVSTHSPFVITSTNNDTVIYDISSNEFFEGDLSNYSYEAIIKGLFHVDPITPEIKDSIERLKTLLNEESFNFSEIRTTIKKLTPLDKNNVLDKRVRNIYLQAINLLADYDELGELDV